MYLLKKCIYKKKKLFFINLNIFFYYNIKFDTRICIYLIIGFY